MSTQVQLRRGTTAEHSTFTGVVGEVTIDTTKKVAVVHDGSTAGGTPLAKESHNHSGVYEPADATILKSAAIGVSVQAYAANLTSWAALATSAKQDALVSGTNIKTINNTSLLGSGDVAVQAPIGTISGIAKGNGTNALTAATAGTDYAKPDTTSTWSAYQVFGKAVQETKTAIGASDIDLRSGNFFTRTISGTTTLTVSNVPSSGTTASIVLELTNGGSATVNWWSGVKWAGGTAPTLTSSGVDVLGFYTHDGGTTWRGMVLAKDSK